MKCPKCDTDNPSDSKYCKECATRLRPEKESPVFRTLTIEERPRFLTEGTVLGGKYKILQLLGRGGMGEVYLAHDQRLKREVALKILPPEYSQDKTRLARFQREATAAAALNHPNICTIYEVGESDRKTYICMEYVEGQTLREYSRGRPLTVEQVLDIGIQMADALEQARQKNIVHRDIKSQNIILTPRGQVKILDFGLAKNLPQAKEKPEPVGVTESLPSTEISSVGMVMGTVSYMSPEQALGLEADHRSDLFSFGIVLYEMLMGKTPFTGDTTEEVLPKIVYEKAAPIEGLRKDVPPDLTRVIGKLLSKKKEDRFQKAQEVLEALQAIKDKVRVPAFAKAGRRTAVKKILWPVLGVTLALIAVFLAFLRPGKKAYVPSAKAPILTALPAKVYGASEYAYLTDAIPSTLSTCLGQIEGLEIKTPPNSFEVDKVKGNLEIIADLYKVNIFVVTSVTAEAGRFFLNVQLVEAKTRGVRWSKQFEGPAGQYMETVRRASEDIRQFLKPSSSPLVTAKGKSANSEAELGFQRGKYFSNRYNNKHEQADFDLAFAAFKQALDLDPKLADAAAEIAMLYEFKLEAEGSQTQQQIIPQLEFWGKKALEINPKCSRGWVALSGSEIWRPKMDWRRQLELSLKAAFYGPEDAFAYTALAIALPSIWLDLVIHQEAMRLDPFYLYPALNATFCFIDLGQAKEALDLIEKNLQIEPAMSGSLVAKANALIYLGQLQESAGIIKSLGKLVAEKKLSLLPLQRLEHLQIIQKNDPAKVHSIMNDIRSTVDSPQLSAGECYDYALSLLPLIARRGHKDLALHILEKLLDAETLKYDFLILCPDFQGLKGEPRFEKILARSRAQFDEALKILEDARGRGEFPKYLGKPLEELLIKLEIKMPAATK